MGGEGVPQSVRTGAGIEFGRSDVLVEHAANTAGGQNIAEAIDKHRRSLA
tara:strand:- start:25 stop:174 length:150 start_codon:yes stop_codon:yes gene_type:complete